MGKLFLIPTPIGNLEDITFRAVRILKETDVIYAEDTRVSSVLLKHLGISKKLRSFHKFNEHRLVNSIIDILRNNNDVAVISDAGTPGISDPAFLIVKACVENGIDVECLPGPTALIPALVVSGMPSHEFCYIGFLPQKKGRLKKVNELKEEKRTMIFYESPHRLLKTLGLFIDVFGDERMVSVSREISKMYEETIRGSLSHVNKHFLLEGVKGEIVIVLSGK